MGVKFKAVDPVMAAGAVAVAVVAYLAYKSTKEIAETAKTVVTENLNPASDKNFIYQGVNGIGEAVTGQKGFSLGSWLYDKMNPNQPTF